VEGDARLSGRLDACIKLVNRDEVDARAQLEAGRSAEPLPAEEPLSESTGFVSLSGDSKP
jgi:hypothetical protein